jgi:hypothetical protein
MQGCDPSGREFRGGVAGGSAGGVGVRLGVGFATGFPLADRPVGFTTL